MGHLPRHLSAFPAEIHSFAVDKELPFDQQLWGKAVLMASRVGFGGQITPGNLEDPQFVVEKLGSANFIQLVSRASEHYLLMLCRIPQPKWRGYLGRCSEIVFVHKPVLVRHTISAETSSPIWSFWCTMVGFLKYLHDRSVRLMAVPPAAEVAGEHLLGRIAGYYVHLERFPNATLDAFQSVLPCPR